MISVKIEGVLAWIKPTEYLDDKFQAYLRATRSAGCRYDAKTKRQVCTLTTLATAIRALGDEGFDVGFADEETRRVYAAYIDKAVQDQQTSAARADQMIQRLEKTRLSPFPYQRDGIKWTITHPGPGAIIADEMGLGKTLQAVAWAGAKDPCLVVCPAFIKNVWASTIETVYGDERAVSVISGRGNFRWPAAGETVIINYDVLPKPDDVGDAPEGCRVIFDEAHFAKNWKSARTKASVKISRACIKANPNTCAVLALTGTPLDNKQMDLWRMLSLVSQTRATFGSFPQFAALADGTRGRYGWVWGTDISQKVAEKIRPVMLRRLKKDVLTQLPPKRYEDILIDCDDDVAHHARELMQELGIDKPAALIKDHISRMLKSKTIFKLRSAIAAASIPAIVEMVQEYEDNETPVVVFSCHRAPVDVLAQREGWETITGDIPMNKRDRIIEDFQNGALKGLAVTIRAGGVGITLTRASHAIFCDLDWTPGANQQAEDRIHRIGQTEPVLIRRLIANHPFVARVREILEDKSSVIEQTIDAAAGDPMIANHDHRIPDVATIPDVIEKSDSAAIDPNLWDAFKRVLRCGVDKKLDWMVDNVSYRAKILRYKVLIIRKVDGEKQEMAYVSIDGGDVNPSMVAAIKALVDNAADVIAAYGKKTMQCGICRRTLSDPESVARGIGPICLGRMNL